MRRVSELAQLYEIAHTFDLRNNDQAKLNIILAIYAAMVSYTQELRGVVERTTVGGCGAILFIDGWFISVQSRVTLNDKIFISAGILLFACVLVFVIGALRQRFNGFADIVRRVNETQMVYEPDVFLEGQSLFPPQWKNFGTKKWREPIFRVAYLSLTLVSLFGAIAIWFPSVNTDQD